MSHLFRRSAAAIGSALCRPGPARRERRERAGDLSAPATRGRGGKREPPIRRPRRRRRGDPARDDPGGGGAGVRLARRVLHHSRGSFRPSPRARGHLSAPSTPAPRSEA